MSSLSFLLTSDKKNHKNLSHKIPQQHLLVLFYGFIYSQQYLTLSFYRIRLILIR